MKAILKEYYLDLCFFLHLEIQTNHKFCPAFGLLSQRESLHHHRDKICLHHPQEEQVKDFIRVVEVFYENKEKQ